MRRIIIVIFIVGVVSVVGVFVYFVGGMSAVYPPIKKYTYSGTFNQLISNIRKYTFTNQNVSFKITDTTGTKENGYAIYMTIEIKSKNSNLSYDLKYEKNNDNDKVSGIPINIVGAHDLINNIGGYTAESMGVDKLINYFDTDFLVKLKNEENTYLKPLWW